MAPERIGLGNALAPERIGLGNARAVSDDEPGDCLCPDIVRKEAAANGLPKADELRREEDVSMFKNTLKFVHECRCSGKYDIIRIIRI